MYDDLQSIVDDLATSLGRSVAIDDPSIRLLAASRHFGDEDAVRVAAVLNRSIDPAVTRSFLEHGIASWTRPGRVHIPGGSDRFCVPVRCNGMLLGYLWLIEGGNPPLAERDIELATASADRAGILLYRRLLPHERSRARHESILRELVSSDSTVRVQAVADLRSEQLFADDLSCYQVLAAQREMTMQPSPSQDVALEAALEEGQRALPDDSTLVAASRYRAWMLLARREPLMPARAEAVAERVVARYRSLAGSTARLVVGVGDVVRDIEDVVVSHQHAFHACRAALLSPHLGDTARWEDLGVIGLLLSMPVQDLLRSSRLPELDVLRSSGASLPLLETLRTFLDNAGDIRRSADQLCVHRATLYNRLKKVEQLTGCSLDNSDDRLLLHLAVKLDDLGKAMRAQALIEGCPGARGS